MMPPSKVSTTFLVQFIRQQFRRQSSTLSSMSSLTAAYRSQPQSGDCFFSYWSLLGACVGWGMTASSALEISNKSPSLTMTQDVVAYSTFWALGSLLMTRNVSLFTCHLSNVGAVLYYYLDAHVDRFQVKRYRAADWQCHGEKTQPTK